MKTKKQFFSFDKGIVRQQAGNILACARRYLKEPIALLLVFLFFVSIVSVLWHQSRLTRRLVESSALQNARQFTKALTEFRTLYTSEVVVPAKRNGVAVTHDYNIHENAIPLPATLSMLIGNRLAKTKGGGKTSLYSPFPFPWRGETGGLRDQFGRDAWNELTRHPDAEFYRFEEQNGRPILRFATSDLMRTSCVSCHNSHPDTPKSDWVDGDVRGVLEVNIPLDASLAQAKADLSESSLVIVGLGIIGLAFIIVVLTRLRRHSTELELAVVERTNDLKRSNKKIEAHKMALDEIAIVAELNRHGQITYLNDQFASSLMYDRADLLGQNIDITNTGYHPKSFFDELWETVNSGRVWGGTIKHLGGTGLDYWLDTTVVPILNSNGNVEKHLLIGFDITKRKLAEQQREMLQSQLLDASRMAGKAEVATGVLHNVGNILNSVNVSADVIGRTLETSALAKLEKASELISEHEKDFPDFVSNDNRGQKLPAYIVKVSDALKAEREHVKDEFQDLVNNIEHIKQIVSVQQSMAKSSGLQQKLSPEALVNDAITANKGSLTNHKVEINCVIKESLPVLVSDKHKILQILVNLIKNAKDALVENATTGPKITVRVRSREDNISFEVIDNGIGIPKNKIDKIFQHGFTTKETGHGFGLHSSANAATELGGALTASSPGRGQGAAFQLTLPADQDTRVNNGPGSNREMSQ